MSAKMVKLGKVLQQYRVTHLVQDETVYKQVTISKHDGVGYRGTKVGKEIGRKRQFLIDLQKHPNTFMFVRQGVSDGALGIAPPEVDGCIATENMPMFSVKGIEVDYLNLLLKSADFKRQLEQIPTLGSAQKAIHERQLLEIEIPLPDADEQRAIVKAVEESRTKVNKIVEETGQQLAHLSQLRQALLREAMQGRLLPQDSTDEPAAVLLQQLQAAKAKPSKAGKRPAAPLFAEEAEAVEGPFEIPASWVWCRFGDYVTFERGKFSARPRNDPHYFGGEHLFIQIGSLDANGTTINSAPQTLNDAGLKVSKKFKAGTIAIAIVGGTIGNMGVLGVDMCFPDSVIGIQPKDNICQEFVLYALRAKQEEIKGFANQMSGQPNIKIPTLANLIIPLPPLAEQQRIVAKLGQLLGHCDALEQRIAESRRLAGQLLQTALREALAGGVDGAKER